ncbi:class I SAM-dependent methyltransferase [Flavobacterium sp. LS1R47]|uniref:Class I SAM-dependent methyltransferase n=1 Tax=Flavobacterium frigoritolerans TaxID=2987686 RepID=A0A9X2ZRV7_9FLAO|nr:class I SAM-dependent methyltransferase [Flavobacterium frigoritolerans]MCV9932963.1 class I SAM-dependent methyltransferase [Flavobacterium frigoritolerans]
MIIKLKSDNTYFLDILYKNPNTDQGLYLKELKNGVIIGNVISATEYHCVFMDGKHSYLPEEGNQTDFQSYCSPLLALNMATEFFNHLYKENANLSETVISWLEKNYDEVDTEKCTIEVATFFIDSGWYKNGNYLLSKYIDGISLQHKIGSNFELKIEGSTVREALQKFSLVALFSHFTNKYAVYTYIDDFFIQKHITMLTNISGVPYFVFYLFIKRIMRSPVQFEKFKPQLEAYFDNKVQFVFTDTHQSRKEFICNKINFDEPVLDFGCGEMQYFKMLLKKGFIQEYHAYDEVDFKPIADKIVGIENADNLHWVESLEEIKGFENQIILSEVIEHNSLEEAKALLIWIRDNTQFTQLFVTTPDKDFNVNYELTEEFRHDDHDFELSNSEFVDLIDEIFPNPKTYYGVGDCVNGVYPTSAVIIQKK